MEKLYPFFPISTKVQKENLRSLIISIVIYISISLVMGVADMLLGWIPVLGFLLGLVFYMLGIYCTIGIIIAIIRFFRG